MLKISNNNIKKSTNNSRLLNHSFKQNIGISSQTGTNASNNVIKLKHLDESEIIEAFDVGCNRY